MNERNSALQSVASSQVIQNQVIQKIADLAKAVAANCGCEIYDLELTGVQGRRTLRVFIDRTEGGASIEDCSNVSRGLSEALDSNDPIDGAYDLEVSTPGLDRPLRQPWHFARVLGKKVQFRTLKSFSELGLQNPKMAATKQLSEVLIDADEKGFAVNIQDEKLTVPYEFLDKAKLVFEMAPKGEKKKVKK